MALKRKIEEDWFTYFIRLWRLFRGARHQRYARLLLIAGVALLSPTVIDVVLHALQLAGLAVQKSSQDPTSRLVAHFAGVTCILSSIIVFVTFEWRSNRFTQADDSALLLTAQSFATLIVDVMRMLYVISDKEANEANIQRFSVLTHIAENHLEELRSQTSRFAHLLPVDLLKLGTEIERQCSWVLSQIQLKDDVAFNGERCFNSMLLAARQTNDYCELAIPELYNEILQAVDRTAFNNAVTEDSPFRTRLTWQNQLLRSGCVGQMETIVNDVLQDLGLYYFVIDYRILSEFPLVVSK